MRIVEVYSHLNGQEHILVHHPEMWPEIEGVIADVDGETMRTKESKEARKQGRILYSPVDLNKEFGRLLSEKGWHESRTSYWVTVDAELIRRTMNLTPAEQKQEIETAGRTAIGSYNQTDFVKDRIAIEVQFGKYAFVAFDLFVKHMACWWAANWGPRRYKKAWKEWGEMAGAHLWYGCINVPLPPTRSEIEVGQ